MGSGPSKQQQKDFLVCAHRNDLDAVKEQLQANPDLLKSTDYDEYNILHILALTPKSIDILWHVLDHIKTFPASERSHVRDFINGKDTWGRPPIHLASSFNRIDMLTALTEFEFPPSSGMRPCNIDETDTGDNGSTCLHAAVANGCVDAVTFLTAKFSDELLCGKKAVNKKGRTPLHTAVLCCTRSDCNAAAMFQIVQHLVLLAPEHLSKKDKAGNTPLQLGVKEAELVEGQEVHDFLKSKMSSMA